MAAIIPLDRATERFVRRAGQAGPDYEAGVRAPKRPWAESATAAESNYEGGVQQGITAKRYGKGVRRAGNAVASPGASTWKTSPSSPRALKKC